MPGLPVPVFGSLAPAAVPALGRVAVAAARVAVLVANGVVVAVHVAVAVHVGVADDVNVAVGVMGVEVAVGVAVIVTVGVDVAVLVPVGVDVFVWVGVGVAVFVAVGVLVPVAVTVRVGVFVSVGVNVAAIVDVGVSPVQSAKATPPPPGNIARVASAIDSAAERRSSFSIANPLILCASDDVRHILLNDDNNCTRQRSIRDYTEKCRRPSRPRSRSRNCTLWFRCAVHLPHEAFGQTGGL